MNKVNKEKKCLLMCATPLQVLIAEKIIELNPGKSFYLIFTDHDYENKVKFRYYYNRLKSQCVQSTYWTDAPGLKNFLSFLIKLNTSKLNIEYDELYLANLERRHFQYLVSKNPNASLFTFDDGIGNINKESHFHSDQKPKAIKKIIWKGLGVRYFISDLRRLSKLHYTIYDNISNVIDTTKYLSLYNDENKGGELESDDFIRKVKFYLGQPLSSIDDKFTASYINTILNKLDIDYYFPHPREDALLLEDFNIVQSQLIFEDYIIEFLKDNSHTEVLVYSFISGTLLNINNLNRVQVKYIYDSFLQESYKDFYSIVEKNFNIEFV